MEAFGNICRMAADNDDIADFVVVYILEAHPNDGWAVPMNKHQISNHRSIEDRLAAAAKLVLSPLPSNMTILADAMSDNAVRAYGANPERLYVIQDGVVEYEGHPGPFMFYPADVDNWLKTYRDGMPLKNDSVDVKGEVRRRADTKDNVTEEHS